MSLYKSRDNSKDPTPWAVICRSCGLQFLKEEDYERQMWAINSGWKCPSCGGGAEWDDDCQETNPPEAQS